jgi:polyhydroxyalkanoate synthesis regulator phasin
MMAKATSKRKTASKYHFVNNFHEVSRHLAEVAQKYNDKLAIPTVSATKDAIALMRKDPKKAIEKISDDGKEWITDIQKEVRQRINRRVDDGRELVRDLADNPRQVIDHYVVDGKAWASETFDSTVEIVEDLAEDGKTLADEIRSDPLAMATDLLQAGKKYIDRLPGISVLEKQMAKKKSTIVQTLNLSTRDDIEKLTRAIDKLNKKFGRLSNRLRG